MAWTYAFIAVVALQRMAELAYARRNTRALLAKGAREQGARHYPWLVAFHALWLLATVVAADASPNIAAVAAYAVLQVARGWVLATLGSRWTTRIIVVPGLRPLRRGPYRWIKHPNYLIVAAEIALVPLAVGAVEVAAAFALLHIPLLMVRIAAEDGALASIS